jgi:hypothetical protein
LKYLCLVYLDAWTLDLPSGTETETASRGLATYDAALRSRGQCVVAEALQPAQTVATVRVRSGRLSVAAGPLVETEQQLDCFYLIDARDLNDAIQMVSQSAGAQLGSVEIHPVRDVASR